MNKEDIQKQIEAVQGLCSTVNVLESDYKRRIGFFCSPKERERALGLVNQLKGSLRTLTETLKPFLGDDKLEV